jgi:hypothetical protein
MEFIYHNQWLYQIYDSKAGMDYQKVSKPDYLFVKGFSTGVLYIYGPV